MTTDPDRSPGWPNDDVVLRAEAQHRREGDVHVSDLVPAEWAAIFLVDRLVASRGRSITVTMTDGVTVDGVLAEVGANWLLLSSSMADSVVALAELVTLSGVGTPTVSRSPTPLLGSAVVWREWARHGRRARWALRDGRVTTGSVWRVGGDALDLVQHPLDRQARAADHRVILPFAAIRWASSQH